MKKGDLFECGDCGYQSPKSYGRCPSCGAWNAMILLEPPVSPAPGGGLPPRTSVPLDSIDPQAQPRFPLGIPELDRVLGGGMVPDSAVLIAGEPGVGKSTLVLALARAATEKGLTVLYCSGEESPQQIRLRADRMQVSTPHIHVLSMATVDDLLESMAQLKPSLVVVDSIQTLGSRSGSFAGGSIQALREHTARLLEYGKQKGTSLWLIGHITREGGIAGPRMLEHMVDVVLQFQGEKRSDLRLLRAEKNRFGSIDEIGVFQMTGTGLQSVADPSGLFLQPRQEAGISGMVVHPAMQGLRALLLEVQALVTDSPFTGNPRRVVVGADPQRLSMLVALMEKRLRLPFFKSDIFLNITNGISLKDPAADAALAAALISSHRNLPIPAQTAILGEIGLGGEWRPVSFLSARLREARHHGYTQALIPLAQCEGLGIEGMELTGISSIRQLAWWIRHQNGKS